MGFWLTAALISLPIIAALLMAMTRARGEDEPAAVADLRIYRDQLAEVERDLERGVISEAEAERARLEVSRRILAADKALARETKGASGGPGWLVGALMLAAIGALTVGLYLNLGSPGMPDLPLETRIALIEEARAGRPGQRQAEAQAPERPTPQISEDHAALVDDLRQAMERHPDDPQGLAILAVEEARLGNYRAARIAQGRAIELLGDQATTQNYVDYAEMMLWAAGGYVSPEMEDVIDIILRRDRFNGPARYYFGLMYAQQGRPDRAFPVWQALLADSPPGAPWIAPIRAEIQQVAALAGYNINVDELVQPQARPAPGPTAAEIAAASDLPPDERSEMIEGMVQGLSERLATEGGPPEDWARLIASLIVLERDEQARAIYDEALDVFAGNEDWLEVIRAAAAPLLQGPTE